MKIKKNGTEILKIPKIANISGNLDLEWYNLDSFMMVCKMIDLDWHWIKWNE